MYSSSRIEFRQMPVETLVTAQYENGPALHAVIYDLSLPQNGM